MVTFFKKTQEDLEQIITNATERRSSDCIRCGKPSRPQMGRSEVVICSNKVCKFRYRLWKNSLFENLRIEKTLVLRVLELFMNNAKYKLIEYETGLDRKTIWRIMKKVSSLLVPKYYSALTEIGGHERIVEVDESKFGKRKYNKGHHVEGVWILGMIERTAERKIKLIVVENRSAHTMEKELSKGISRESTIYSDMWKGYNHVKDKFVGHKTVNHSSFFKDPITKVHTNTIEGTWSALKVNVPYRGRTKDKIQLYLVRFMILRNENGHPLDEIIKYLL